MAATLQAETYYQYVARSVAYDSDLTDALSGSNEPLITMESLQPLAMENAAFLDGVIATATTSLPSTSAIISVPLLVQITRDWSAGGQIVRDLTYRPLLQSLIPFLLDIPSPRILAPDPAPAAWPSCSQSASRAPESLRSIPTSTHR